MVASPVPWLMPQMLLDAVDMSGITATPTNRSRQGGTTADGPIAPGQVVQYASLKRMQTDIAGLPLTAGTFVMYDLEGWKASPKAEQDAPYQSMRRFVTAAQDADLKAILVPGNCGDKVRAAKQEADVFVMQIQAIINPIKYRKAVREIIAVIDPAVALVAELSVGRVTTLAQMKAQYLASVDLVDGYCLWYGGPAADGGSFEQQANRASSFFEWLAAQ